MTVGGGGVICHLSDKDIWKGTISQSVHKVSRWGNNDQSNSYFTCSFLNTQPSLGSQTDLLALELCTAPYCPPGHNKHKCLESPEWKLGLFLNRHRSRPQLVHRKHLGPMLYELMKDPSSREVNHWRQQPIHRPHSRFEKQCRNVWLYVGVICAGSFSLLPSHSKTLISPPPFGLLLNPFNCFSYTPPPIVIHILK